MSNNLQEYAEALWNYSATGFKMSTGDTDIEYSLQTTLWMKVVTSVYSFMKYERMIILEYCPNDWIKVNKNGVIGVVPLNYVKKISQQEFNSPPPPNVTSPFHFSVQKSLYSLKLFMLMDLIVLNSFHSVIDCLNFFDSNPLL
jgi:hypothetical protein